MHKASRWIGPLALATALALPALAQAGVRVSGTRFVYPGGQKDIVVNLQNEGDAPVLVQTWLDAGDPQAKPGAAKLPFVVLPPLTRVEPHRGQAVRIGFLGGAVPQDRESVYWINVLEIPPKAKDASGNNRMNLAFRTRMKMFFRPKGLDGQPDEAADAVQWAVVPAGQGYALRASNASDYDVTYTSLKLSAGGASFANDQGGMVPPHGSLDFPLAGLSGAAAAGQVQATWINDYGSGVEHSYTLRP